MLSKTLFIVLEGLTITIAVAATTVAQPGVCVKQLSKDYTATLVEGEQRKASADSREWDTPVGGASGIVQTRLAAPVQGGTPEQRPELLMALDRHAQHGAISIFPLPSFCLVTRSQKHFEAG